MTAMTKKVVFAGSGLGVSMYLGNAGDTKAPWQDAACSRADAPFLLATVKGAVLRVNAPDAGNNFLMTPGRHTDELPDIVPGPWHWIVQEDGTELICIGPVDERVRAVWTPFRKAVVALKDAGQFYVLEKDGVAIVVTGSVVVAGVRRGAKSIVHAQTMEVHINGGDEPAVLITGHR